VRYRTNVGIVEVTGRPVTVEISATVSGSRVSAVIAVDLAAYEGRQMNSLLKSAGLENAFNAMISLRVVGGEGRVIGYGSVIDNRSMDPTFINAQ
jgi:hypothetical protein